MLIFNAIDMKTRGGIKESGQPGNFGLITGLSTANFKLDDQLNAFNIKNNTDLDIELSVRPAGGGGFVYMKVYPGWNVEIVSEIELDVSITDTDLSWGY